MGVIPHILLAKDNDDYASLLERAFKLAGIGAGLQVVRDGQEALEYLTGENAYSDRVKHPFPKLVLLDLQMPRVDGFEVLSVVRQKLHLSSLPIIVLTDSNNPTHIKRAYEAGATSYFIKPIDLEGLDEMIHVLYAYWLKFNHFTG
jgi:CheY-like chemotaxis protein